jgi:hypothetical protein
MSSKHLNPLWDLPEKHRNFGNTSRLQDAIITVVADIIKNIMGFFFFFLLRTYNELLIASTESTHGAISDLTLQKWMAVRDYPCGGHERPAETLPVMYLPNTIYLHPCFLISLFFG